MKYSKDKIDAFNIRVSSDLKDKYNDFCKNNGYSVSKRIRILIENDMKNGKI